MESINNVSPEWKIDPNKGDSRNYSEILRVAIIYYCFYIKDHSFSTYAKFSEKLTFLTPKDVSWDSRSIFH